MAFSKGQVSTEGASIKRYVGVGSMFVKNVNANKAESDAFFGRESEGEPQYVTMVDSNGTQVPNVRISFLVEADPEKYPDFEFKSSVNIFLRREPRINRDGTKKQVIDKYGRTAWATQEEIANHIVPTYSNGKKANISSDYRVAYNGEEDLTNFLIAYLNIPAPANYVNGEWVDKPAAEIGDSEARLEHIEDYFKGNFNELKEIIKYQPLNKVKVCFGVRKTDDGKEYQNCYTRKFLKNSVTNYSKLDAEIKDAQNNGAYSTTEFDTQDLHEYVVNPTNFNEMPFSPENGITSTPWG